MSNAISVPFNSSVPVIPEATVTGLVIIDDGREWGERVATVGLVAGYYVRAGYWVIGGAAVLLGWASWRAGGTHKACSGATLAESLGSAEDAALASALEWCSRGFVTGMAR